MALQLKHNGYTPNWGGRDLSLLAQGSDDYGNIWGGTLGVFDFGKADYPDQSKVGTEFYNLRSGKAPMTGGAQQPDGSAQQVGIHAAKGLTLSGSAGQYYRSVRYPDAFKLDTLPAYSSVLLWWWLTNSATVNAGDLNCVAGYGYGTVAANQWTLVQQGVSNKFKFMVNDKSIIGGTAGGGETHLYSVYVKRASTADWTASAYIDGALVGSVTGSYPFNNPLTSYPSQTPVVGPSGGYGPSYNGVVHRTGGRIVDPATFSMAEWLAEEIAANAGRW